ncbi:MAG: DEAD/DEAH box helicase [Bacteroidetes bacterium]|nr:DEAD/DEAH box helicase [Bacteroidota bacterium]
MHFQKIKEKEFGENRFVFTIVSHPVFDLIIEAFAVKVNAKGVFGYEFRKVTKRTFHDFFAEISDVEKECLNLIDQYSDENIQKRFNRNKIKVKDFLCGLQPDFIAQFIKPFIDRKIYEVANILALNNLPLYYKGDANERIQEKAFHINKNIIKPFFKFEKKSDHTLYSLYLYNEDVKIDILDKDATLISVSPCTLMLDGEILRFDEEWDGKKLMPFFKKDTIVIPKSSEIQYFQKFVLKAVRNYPVEALGFNIEVYKQEITPIIKLENSIDGHIVAGLYFNYGNYVTYAYKDRTDNHTFLTTKGESYKFFKVKRNPKLEEEYATLLLSIGLKHKSSLHFLLADKINNADDINDFDNYMPFIDWVIANKDFLERKGFVLKQDFTKRHFNTSKAIISIDVDEKQDWFDLKIVVAFGGFQIPFIKLKDNILKGNREFELPDGEIALIPIEWFARFKDILRHSVDSKDGITLKRHHYTLLSNLDNGKSYSNNLQEIIPGKSIEVPASINAVLRNYQVEGYRWMYFLYKNGFGGVLADDMGLGKTLQAITLLCKIYCDKKNDINTEDIIDDDNSSNLEGLQLDVFSSVERLKEKTPPSLIVMPLSLVHNWMCEINRFAPELNVYQHVGTARTTKINVFSKYDVVLTTYGTIRNDIELIKNFDFHYLILDESQVIKNAVSKVFHAVKSLNSKHRLVMTGTPVENSLTDLWSQFSFLNPGMLGNLNFFKDEYVIPIEKEKHSLKREKLQKMISPFILRRTKDEVEKELPELTEMIHYCEMTDEQASIYEEKKSEVRNFIIEHISRDGIDKSRFHILSGLMNLRLIANHPKMTDPNYSLSSGKYVEVVRSIDKLVAENHKVLIFSQFVKHLNIIKEYVDEMKIPYSFLTGNTPEKERKLIIKEFQNNPERRLFLISMKAGGVGLNLTGADYVFLLDPWWNPAVESQAVNRAHRIGQHKKVFVYKFITRNSVEEKIMSLQRRKSELAGMVINSNNPFNIMDIEQLKNIL